jgi:hypothetical protein
VNDSRVRSFRKLSFRAPPARISLSTVKLHGGNERSWTDKRLDDGFDRVSADIALVHQDVGDLRRELRTEVGSLREDNKALRKEMHTEIGSLRQEMHEEIGSLRQEMHEAFGSLNRTLLQIGGGVIVALLGIVATQL